MPNLESIFRTDSDRESTEGTSEACNGFSMPNLEKNFRRNTTMIMTLPEQSEEDLCAHTSGLPEGSISSSLSLCFGFCRGGDHLLSSQGNGILSPNPGCRRGPNPCQAPNSSKGTGGGAYGGGCIGIGACGGGMKQPGAKNGSGPEPPWRPRAKARSPLASNSRRTSSSMSRRFTSSRMRCSRRAASQSSGRSKGEGPAARRGGERQGFGRSRE